MGKRVNGPIVKREYILDRPIAEVRCIFAYYDQMSAALKDADKRSRIQKGC